MTTPNLDATQHQWVELLARFMFSIEYQKGDDNAATNALSQVTWKLNTETMMSILYGVTMGTTERPDAHDPAVAKADEEMHKPVQETVILAWAAHVDLHVTDWVTAQQEDPILKTAIEWISGQKVQDLKHLLGDDTNTEEGKTILQEWKNLTLYQGGLYHCHTPTGKLEEVLQFIVPKAHWVTAMNGCHHNAGHQGQQQTLCLLHDQILWSRMATQMQKVISSCKQCLQHDGTHAKASVQPIIITASLELLYVDFTSIETMMELDQPPNVVNVLAFATTLWNTLWQMWLLIRLQKLLLSFCGKVISWSLDPQPSTWVTEESTLRATSSESSVSLWEYGRLGLHLTILKPMNKWNKLTKCWCTW